MARSRLQAELQKRNPFDSLEQEVSLNLIRTQDHLAQPFHELFQTHGLTGPQYNVLRILRGHGGDGVPSHEIGAQMVARVPDVTRLVDRLEAAGLAERSRTAKDRRVVLVRITPAGLDVLARLDQPVLDAHRRSLAHLTRDELLELNRLLVKARECPSHCRPPGGVGPPGGFPGRADNQGVRP
jgi:DNA-binding MarR family transcriptional regulator